MRARTVALLLGFALSANAQQQPDVAIIAVVHAKELKFEIVPETNVKFSDPRNINVWVTDRENLPKQVEPNVIYRDIGIRLTITSTLPDIEKIVDEALASPAPAADNGGLHEANDVHRKRAVSRRSGGRSAAADDHQHNARRPKHVDQRAGDVAAAAKPARNNP